MSSDIKISFCTTCKGRLEHLQKTLPENILQNLPKNPADPDVEFVLLDYNCPQGTADWALNNPDLKSYIEQGILKVGKLDEPERTLFHVAHAKNMAHRLSSREDNVFVCNVDADNYMGEGFARFLADHFRENPTAIVIPDPSLLNKVQDEHKGFFGRIALHRSNFIWLGGYDEEKFPEGWGGEDTNLMIRARIARLSHIKYRDTSFLRTIPHTDDKRAEYTVPPQNHEAEVMRIQKRTETKATLKGKFVRLQTLFGAAVSSSGDRFGMGNVEVFTKNDAVKIHLASAGARVSAKPSVSAAIEMMGEYTIGRVMPRLQRMMSPESNEYEF